MRNPDKLLIAIVAGILALVVVVFAVTLLRPEASYQPDQDPEGAVHNYLLALEKGDFARAYEYLSLSLSGYPPTVERFERDVDRYSYSFHARSDNTLAVESADITGDSATVTVKETRFFADGLFDSSQSVRTFDMELRKERGDWKIYDADSYFVSCWTYDDGCR